MIQTLARSTIFLVIAAVLITLAACGGDEPAGDEPSSDTASDTTGARTETPEPGPTAKAEPTATPEDTPKPTAEPDPTATPTVESEPASEPAENVDLAPELAGLTEWRNTDPLTLEDLRGEPVVLVFWNSI